MENNVTNKEIMDTIKKSGGRLLTNINVFDLYTGENVKEYEKSLAYKLTYQEETRTLTDEEVMQQFNKIIQDVESICHAKLRDN